MCVVCVRSFGCNTAEAVSLLHVEGFASSNICEYSHVHIPSAGALIRKVWLELRFLFVQTRHLSSRQSDRDDGARELSYGETDWSSCESTVKTGDRVFTRVYKLRPAPYATVQTRNFILDDRPLCPDRELGSRVAYGSPFIA